MRFIKPLFFLSLCLLFASALTFAQSATATLSGTVVDQQESVVNGVKITVQNDATSLKREVTSNDAGHFIVPVLPPGNYTLTAMRDGFAPVKINNIVLNVNDERALRIQLKPGNVSETVTIQGEELGVIKNSPEVSTVVDQQFVANLPLNGRSFQSLIALTPGVVRTNTEGQFSVNGQRDNANYFTIDGVSANIGISATNQNSLGQGGAGQIAGFNAVGGTSGLISVDAMQEFRIQTSTYSAEFGRTPGGQIQIISRGGKSRYEGTLFEYLRNDKFDANNWFNNSARLRKAPLRQNDFGGVFGGPIQFPKKYFGPLGFENKDRAFFFFSYEALRLRLPVTVVNALVPSLSLRISVPALVRPYLDAMPLPNGADTTNGAAFFNVAFSNPTSTDSYSLRIDHNLTSKVTLFGRFNNAPSVGQSRGASTLTTVANTRKNIKTLTFGSTQTFTNSIVNEARGNYSKNTGSSTFTNDSFGGAIPVPDSLLFPSFASPDTGIADVNAALQGVAFTRGSNVENVQQQLNIVDNLTWVARNHNLKFGADYRQLTPVAQPRTYALLLNFFSLANLQAAAPGLVQVFSNDRVRVQAKNLSLYGQDSWRLSKRLTLDLGLRWEFNPPPSGRDGDILYTVDRVNDATNVLLAPAGTPLYSTIKSAFAPRIGVAYHLRNSQNWGTVLRGGFGTFYDLGSGSALATTATYPHRRVNITFNNAGTPMPIPTALITPPTLTNLVPPYTNQELLGFDPDYRLPRTYQWNLAIEQAVGRSQTVSISYVGAAGRDLLRQERQLPPSTQSTRFLNLYVYRNSDYSDYNALQLQFTRRFSKGFQALANYTWGKAFDTATTDTPPSNNPGAGANQLNVATERGLSNFDVRHVFNLTTSYDIPSPSQNRVVKAILGSWSIDEIFTTRTGLPINVTVSRNLGFGTILARPDLVAGTDPWIVDPLVAGGRKLNAAAFSVPSTVRQGTMQRNTLTGFGFHQLDFALRRQFALSERVRLQFKGELFNIFNHPNFTNPASSLGTVSAAGVFTPTSTFGRTTSLLATSFASSGFSALYQPGGPRSVQLTAKLSF